MFPYFKNAEQAHKAYLTQRELTDKNYEFFKTNIDARSTIILESNHRRLRRLANIYTVMRMSEINTAYANQNQE